MSRMFLWMGLTETGTSTERTSSWAAKLMPTQPSLCISGDCEYNSVCLCFAWRMCTPCSLMLCSRVLQNQWFHSEQCRDSRQHPYLQRASHLWRAGYLCVRCNQQHRNTVRLCGGQHNRYGSPSVKNNQYFLFSLYDSVPPKLPTWMWDIFYFVLCFLCRKTTATDCNRWCHQRNCFITGCWSTSGHHHYSASAQDKKPKGRLFVRQRSITALIFPTCFVSSIDMFLVFFTFCLWSEATLPPENCPSQ